MSLPWLNLEPLVRRLVQEDGLEDRTEALRCIEEYKRFLVVLCNRRTAPLQARGGGGESLEYAEFAPSDKVWRVWNRHVLDMRNYIRDCERLLREAGSPASVDFVHHVPLPAPASPADVSRVQRAYQRAREAYADEFCGGDLAALDPELWGEHAPHGRGVASVGRLLRKVPPGAAELSPANVDLSTVVPRLVRDHAHELPNTAEFVAACVREYRRFLELPKESPLHLTPSRAVDLVWHEHVLDTRKYAEDSLRMAGMLLLHNPHYEKPAVFHEAGFQKTRAMYEQRFGDAPPDAVWLVRGESGGCEGGYGASEPESYEFISPSRLCCGDGEATCCVFSCWHYCCHTCHNWRVPECLTCRECVKPVYALPAVLLLGPPTLAALGASSVICSWLDFVICCCFAGGRRKPEGERFQLIVRIDKAKHVANQGREEYWSYNERRFAFASCMDACKFACCVTHDWEANPPIKSAMGAPPTMRMLSEERKAGEPAAVDEGAEASLKKEREYKDRQAKQQGN